MRRGGLFAAGLACVSAALPAAPPPHTIIAHRGLEQGAPDNTLAALRHAVERGVTIIELDLRVTKDGHIVVIHDKTVDRTTNGHGRVADLTLAQLKALDAGSRAGPAFAGERIPTLAEVLDFVRATPARLLLDLKSGTSLSEVVRLVREHGAESKVILGLRRASDVAKVRSADPDMTIVALIAEPEDVARYVAAGANIIRLWSDWVEENPSQVRQVQALGPMVWVMIGRHRPRKDAQWRALHARMLAIGAQGIITDRPDLVEDRH